MTNRSNFKGTSWGSSTPKVFISHHITDYQFVATSLRKSLKSSALANWIQTINTLYSLQEERRSIIDSSYVRILCGKAGCGKSLLTDGSSSCAFEQPTGDLARKWISNKSSLSSQSQLPGTCIATASTCFEKYLKSKQYYEPVSFHSSGLVIYDSLEECFDQMYLKTFEGGPLYSENDNCSKTKPELTYIDLEKIQTKVKEHLLELDRRIEKLWKRINRILRYIYHCSIDLRAKIRKVVRLLFKNIDDTDSDKFELNLLPPM